MPITYDAGSNTITVIGTNEGAAYSFEDIYQADVANSWGVFQMLDENTYLTKAKIQIGDGYTYTLFSDAGKILILDDVTDTEFDWAIRYTNNAHVTFGNKQTIGGRESGTNGVIFVYNEPDNYNTNITHEDGSYVEYYGCVFTRYLNSKVPTITGYNIKMATCDIEFVLGYNRNVIILNSVLHPYREAFTNPFAITLDQVIIIPGGSNSMYLGNTTIEIANARFYVLANLASIYDLQAPNIITFRNVDSNSWQILWRLNAGHTSGELRRVYDVTFRIVDKEGNPLPDRTLKVYDRNGVLLASGHSDSDGYAGPFSILYARLVNPYDDGTYHMFTDDDWEYFYPYTVEVWNGPELEYRGVLTSLSLDNRYVEISVDASHFTLADAVDVITSELKRHDTKMVALRFIN